MRRIAALVPRGFVGRDTLIAAQAAAAETRERIGDLDNEAARLRVEGVGRTGRYRLALLDEPDRHRAAGARAVPAAGAGRRPDDRPRPVGGQVIEVKVGPGDVVAPGSALATIARNDRSGETIALLYVPAGEGRRIQRGMRAELLPDTVEREVHGTIVGRVLSVSPLPATRGNARILRNDQLVDQLLLGGAVTEVQVALERDPATPTGFAGRPRAVPTAASASAPSPARGSSSTAAACWTGCCRDRDEPARQDPGGAAARGDRVRRRFARHRARPFRQFVPLDELRTLCGVSRDGAKASSVLRAGRRLGLTAKGLRAEPEHLKNLAAPMIAFVNFNHFVVVEGSDGKHVWINDPADGDGADDRGILGKLHRGGAHLRAGARLRPGRHKAAPARLAGRPLCRPRAAARLPRLVSLALVIPGIVLPVFSRIFVDYVLVRGMDDYLVPLLIGMAVTGRPGRAHRAADATLTATRMVMT